MTVIRVTHIQINIRSEKYLHELKTLNFWKHCENLIKFPLKT